MNMNAYPSKKEYPYTPHMEELIWGKIKRGIEKDAEMIDREAAAEAVNKIIRYLTPLIESIANRYYQRLTKQYQGVQPEIAYYLSSVGRAAVAHEIYRYNPEKKAFKFPDVASYQAKQAVSQACERLKLHWSRSS